jgi:hypothetical protein
MPNALISNLSFAAVPTPLAVALAVIALVCGGWAFHSALHSLQSPSWVRADAALIAVALYAFAFGRLQTIDAEPASQILAYTVGFLLASLFEPLRARFSPSEKPDSTD